jgi:uncharacterized protein YgiM (DUF1202 family)
LSGIDPDQKALPKDLPAQPNDTDSQRQDSPAKAESNPDSTSESKPSTEVSAEGNVEQVAPEGPPAEATADVPAASRAKAGTGPQTRFIKAATLNIRSQPNRFSKIVGSLKGGDEVHVKIHDGWAKLEEGRWIRSRWLVKSRPSGFSDAGDEGSAKPKKSSKSRKTTKKKSKKSRK